MTLTPALVVIIICLATLLIGGHVYQAARACLERIDRKTAIRYGILGCVSLVSGAAVASNFIYTVAKL